MTVLRLWAIVAVFGVGVWWASQNVLPATLDAAFWMR